MMPGSEAKRSYIWVKYFPTNLFSILDFLFRRGNEVLLSEIRERFKDDISNSVIKDTLRDLSMNNFVREVELKDRRRKKILLLKDGKRLLRKLKEVSKIMALSQRVLILNFGLKLYGSITKRTTSGLFS